jgi:hypothetical protein
MCPADTIREHIYAEKLRQLRQQLSETFDEVERSEILRQVEEVEAEIERTSRGALAARRTGHDTSISARPRAA